MGTHRSLYELYTVGSQNPHGGEMGYTVRNTFCCRLYTCSISVLAGGGYKEWCFRRDQSIAVVLIQPHQKKIVLLRVVEHPSSTL